MADNNGKKAIKAGVGYTVGNVLVKGISFISIPVFARLLSVADYGIYNTYTAYSQLLFVVIGFALHSSIKNAKLDYPDRVNEYCSSITLPILGNLVLFLIIAFCFANPLALLLSLDEPVLVIMVVVESFSLAMITFYNSVLAIDYRYKEYVILSLIYAVLGISLSVLFILKGFSDKRYLGRALGAAVSALAVAVYVFIRLYKNAPPKVNKEFWNYGLRISLPIIPHGLSQIVLSQFDRLMIKGTIGSTEAGLYSFAYNIGAIFTAVASSLDTAWTQWFFERMQDKDYAKIRKVANAYAGLVTAGAVMLMLISPELVTLMGGHKYDDSRACAMPIVLAMFFSFMYYFPASVEYYYKKTKLIAVGTMSAAVLNVILNAVFIPKFGWIAAAYTTVVCYLLYYVLHVFFAYKVHGEMIYDMRWQMVFVLIASIMSFAALRLIDAAAVRHSLLTAILAVMALTAYKYREEIKQWKN